MLRHDKDGLSACIINAVLAEADSSPSFPGLLLDLFLEDADLQRSMIYWFGADYVSQPELKGEQIQAVLSACIAQIDDWLNDQVNEIIHNERIQQLEAS